MKTVYPEVFLIAKTSPDRAEMRRWLDSLAADQFAIPAEEATIGTLLTTLAGKRCYMSFQVGLNPNITKVRQDLTAFIDNILKVGHGSVIEHVNYTFAIENVSRVFTAEMNRHRAGMAVSEGSMRFIRFEDIPYWEPHSILDRPNDDKIMRERKKRSRAVFERAFKQAEDNYRELCLIWGIEDAQSFQEKKGLTSMFRRVIPQGVATGGVWTGNLRALRHIFTMRCDPAAEEEICYVASTILERMIEAEPDIFGDFHLDKGYWKVGYRKV